MGIGEQQGKCALITIFIAACGRLAQQSFAFAELARYKLGSMSLTVCPDVLETRNPTVWFSFLTAAVIALACTGGCTPSKKAITPPNWRDEVQKLERAGWTKVEVLGVTGEAVLSSPFQDDKAPALTAFWMTSGKQSNKRLAQKGKKYLLLSLSKADGDSFVVVFSKPGG
jgi:hypothetical protein